jgi:hypothetical protein
MPPPSPIVVSDPLRDTAQPNPWPSPEPWPLPAPSLEKGQENLMRTLLMALVLPSLRGKCLALAGDGRVVAKQSRVRKRKALELLVETAICVCACVVVKGLSVLAGFI